MSLAEEEIRRHSRTLLLRPVGGRGLESLLSTRVRFEGRGAILDAAALFATRAGLSAAADPPFCLTVAVGELEEGADSGAPLEVARLAPPAVVALSGARGVAIVVLEAGASPCPRCRLARARESAGAAAASRGAVAVAAGALVASLALARCLPAPLGGARRPSIYFFARDEPFPVEAALASRPDCLVCPAPSAGSREPDR